MASEKDLVSMAQSFTGLPMDSLIGGPLNAAATANASMALTQTKFMLDTCFTAIEVAPKAATASTPAVAGYTSYEPIMIKMSLTRGYVVPGSPAIPEHLDPSDNTKTIPAVAAVPPKMESFTTTFDLPLLTIIPLNSLGVDEVDITFEMEVKSSYGEEQSQETEKNFSGATSFETKIGWGPFSASVKGSASYDSKDKSNSSSHYEKSNSAKYTVHVHAGQLPLPKGVNTIIEAFTQAITPYEMPKP